MRNYVLISFSILISFFQLVSAQQQEDAITEKYLENQEVSGDFTLMQEELTWYKEHPLRINQAGADELMRCPLIGASKAIAMMDHRKKYGDFISIHELQVIGFDAEEIVALAPYISLVPGIRQQFENKKQQLKLGQVQILSSTKFKQQTELPKGALGNDLYHNIRFRYHLPGSYSFGITLEKDAGEKYLNPLPDFV